MKYNVGMTLQNKYGFVTIIDTYIKNKEIGDRYYVLKWDSGEVRDVSMVQINQHGVYTLPKVKRTPKLTNKTDPRTMRKRNEVTGKTFTTHNSGEATIVAYHSSKDVEVVFKDTGNIYRGVRLERVKDGSISDVLARDTKHKKVRYRYVGNLFGGSQG